MDDHRVYLEKLNGFSRMLRLEGLPVSPKETGDASRILIDLGLADKEQMKTALRTVYAKSREEQLIFDRVFDGYFISEAAMRRQAQEQARREQEERQARQEAEAQNLDLNPDQLDTFAAMPKEEREKLLNISRRYRENARSTPKLYGNFIHSVFAKALLEQQLRSEDAGVGIEATDPEMGLLYRDISQFSDTEIPKAISIIQTVSRQINGELSAKRSRKAHSGALDFRRTIRKGLETGGSLYRLRYKRRPTRRKRLVLLCDVSGSMMQFSEFALRFIQSLNQVSESGSVFLFSEELYEADAFHLQNMDLFRDYVRQCGIYGKGTDLGSALEKLAAMRPPVINSATTLLILSDTKTVDQGRAVEALLRVKAMAGRVLWLNPIPQGHWQYLRSVQSFAGICPMVACNTLQALAAACKRITQ